MYPLALDPAPPYAGHCTHVVFDTDVPVSEISGTLELAIIAAESLFGPDRLGLDAGWAIDRDVPSVTIETRSAAGHTLALLFLGLCRREFGTSAVTVHRIHTPCEHGTGVAP